MRKLEWLKQRLAEPFGEECVEWPWAKKAGGYGKVNDLSGRPARYLYVHRVSCEYVHGPAPSDKPMALHSCDNPACFNPKHLRWGDHKSNVFDAVSRGRNSKPPNSKGGGEGEANYGHKLCNEDVLAIRDSYIPGATSYNSLAKQFGVNHTMIRKIVKQEAWKHI